MDSQTGIVSICGYGPTLVRTYTEIAGDVMACNKAHDFLIGKGIIPKWAIIIDAHPIMVNALTPHPDVTYLIASRCHESLFERLEGFNVITWHLMEEGVSQEMLEKHGVMEPMIHGGSASVTRALVLTHVMGYRDIRLFGADSSFDGDLTHITQSMVDEHEIQVFANQEWFKTTAWMAGQCEDFRLLAPDLKTLGAEISVYGWSLMASLAKSMGFKVYE